MSPLNETHALLLAYAKSTSSLTVAGTIEQFITWYKFVHGVEISDRTFKRHTRQLADAGLISVRHTAKRTWYTLLKDEIEVPTYEFVPVADGVFDVKQSGTMILDHSLAVAPEDEGVDYSDFDLDALEASWPNPAPKPEGRLFRYPDAPEGTVQAAGCWSCRIVKVLGAEPGICPACGDFNMTIDGFDLCSWCVDNPDDRASYRHTSK